MKLFGIVEISIEGFSIYFYIFGVCKALADVTLGCQINLD